MDWPSIPWRVPSHLYAPYVVCGLHALWCMGCMYWPSVPAFLSLLALLSLRSQVRPLPARCVTWVVTKGMVTKGMVTKGMMVTKGCVPCFHRYAVVPGTPLTSQVCDLDRALWFAWVKWIGLVSPLSAKIYSLGLPQVFDVMGLSHQGGDVLKNWHVQDPSKLVARSLSWCTLPAIGVAHSSKAPRDASR